MILITNLSLSLGMREHTYFDENTTHGRLYYLMQRTHWSYNYTGYFFSYVSGAVVYLYKMARESLLQKQVNVKYLLI